MSTTKHEPLDPPDFLDEIIAEGERRSPGFAERVEAAYQRRVAEREAGKRRWPSRGHPAA